MEWTSFLIIYLIFNSLSFILYGYDKRLARLHRYRISERTLILSAAFGPVGALAGMLAFHHKIRKHKFFVGVPILLFLHLFLVAKYLISGNLSLF